MLRILEVSWLLVVVSGSAFGTYKAFVENFAESIYIFLITSVAFLMYLMKRKQRLNMEKNR
ncbi:MAG: hypothetical protein ACHQNT_09680 [Bacteroidia bacterium]